MDVEMISAGKASLTQEQTEVAVGFVRLFHIKENGENILSIFEQETFEAHPIFEISINEHDFQHPTNGSIVWEMKYEGEDEDQQQLNLFSLTFDKETDCEIAWNEIRTIKDAQQQMEGKAGEEEAAGNLQLPECTMDNLAEIAVQLENQYPAKQYINVTTLKENDGDYIKKLLRIFDNSEDFEDTASLHLIFQIFKRSFEIADEELLQFLLNDDNFIPVVAVFEHNPSLLQPVNFRDDLKDSMEFKEIIAIPDRSITEKIHFNFRILAIKDNVLSRLLSDSASSNLDRIVNNNNNDILTYLSQSEDYMSELKRTIQNRETRNSGMDLLRELMNLIRCTKPGLNAKIGSAGGIGGNFPYYAGCLYPCLFEDGQIFRVCSEILGDPQSSCHYCSVAMEILSALVIYRGGEALRTFIASEADEEQLESPHSCEDHIQYQPRSNSTNSNSILNHSSNSNDSGSSSSNKTQGSSLFTGLLFALEYHGENRAQISEFLKNLFNVVLGRDGNFLNVLYPEYMDWLLQPLKHGDRDISTEENSLYALQGSIIDMLTFCLLNHGYRAKYILSRHPIHAFISKLMASGDKFLVLLCIKLIRSCLGKKESFYTKYIIQNNLLVPVFKALKENYQSNNAISSAVLELVAFVTQNDMNVMVEHIYLKFYTDCKNFFAPLFKKIKEQYDDCQCEEDLSHSGELSSSNKLHSKQLVDEKEEESYFSTEDIESIVGQEKGAIEEDEGSFIGPIQSPEVPPNLPPLRCKTLTESNVGIFCKNSKKETNKAKKKFIKISLKTGSNAIDVEEKHTDIDNKRKIIEDEKQNVIEECIAVGNVTQPEESSKRQRVED